MAGIAVSGRVIARNSLGRFIADCEQAGHDTVEKSIKRGATMSRRMAPRKTGALAGSIESHMLSRTSGAWAAHAHYAMWQEEGTAPRQMIGNPYFHFFWENQGRWWQPGFFTDGPDVINHPGNPPSPFLRPAYEAVMAQVMAIARAEYPG